jgi:hypothetical protein
MTEPNFDRPLRPIAEFAAMNDFPQSALGEFVDIGGYTGVVVEIVSNSIKVRSREGTTQRFNYHTLRRLYRPRIAPEPEVPLETARTPSGSQSATDAPSASPEQREIEDPNFDREVKSIRDLAGRPDFPRCAFGVLVEIGDYTGVVVAIVNQSLKVRSRQGTSRKYNAEILRKLYGKA